MAKKTKRHIKAARSATTVSALRAERGIDALTPAFVHWVESTQDLPAAGAMLILEPIKAFVAAYFEATPSSDVTSFEAVPFGLALATLLEPLDEDDDDEIALICEAITLYIEFLGETDAWTGSELDFNAIDDLFHEDDDGIPDIMVPVLTQEEELAGLAGTELARRLDALLQWIGEGKDVTSTGALRLKDIEGAAAAIGVAARGVVQSAKKKQDALFGDDAGRGIRAGEPLRTVKTMKDEPKLSLFWAALQAAKLVEVGSTRVRLTSLAEKFLAEEDGFSLTALQNFTANFLKLSMRDEDAWDPWTVQASMAQTAVLVAATTDTPPALERIRTATEAAGSSSADDLVGRLVLGYLDYLAELGLLTIGTHVRVPPAVVGCVAAAMEDILRFDDGPEYELELPRPEPVITILPPAAKRKNPKPRGNPKAPILQLKVSIQRASPPIWRRLLVRSDVTLAQLHDIIQASFEWLDYHLHEFNVGGRQGTSYGPPDPESYGDAVLDEAKYTLGQILAAEGDSMAYTYDFGDDWEHAIKVEKVLPADPKAAVVRCTGGRGAAPAEDCGGVFGWSNVVEVVINHSHEEHEEYRDFLGLEPGEKFDPKAFDWAELNEELEYMF